MKKGRGRASAPVARVSIRHVSWREGRPRFSPGPGLRAEGFTGQDLRHPDGRWFSLEEATDWARRFSEARQAGAAARPAVPALPPPVRGAVVTLADVFAEWRASPAFLKKAPATRSWYRRAEEGLAAFDPDLYATPARAITKPIVVGLSEALEQRRGLATMRAIMATLSAALGYAERKGRIPVNPALRLRLESPPPRLRSGTPAEMRALIAAADLMGRPEIGDAVMLGLMTGQRQADRLALRGGQMQEGRLLLRQAKTGALVDIPPMPALVARLEAARQRRVARIEADSAAGRQPPPTWAEVVIDERRARPWRREWYAHVFASVRAAAAAGIVRAGGVVVACAPEGGEEREGTFAARVAAGAEPLLAPVPSLADLRDQDLRDTAVTWLASAGATIPEICAVTGHSLQSATQILRHYLATNADQADAAMLKLARYLDRKGGL